jgi:hypothetical protein
MNAGLHEKAFCQVDVCGTTRPGMLGKPICSPSYSLCVRRYGQVDMDCTQARCSLISNESLAVKISSAQPHSALLRMFALKVLPHL